MKCVPSGVASPRRTRVLSSSARLAGNALHDLSDTVVKCVSSGVASPRRTRVLTSEARFAGTALRELVFVD